MWRVWWIVLCDTIFYIAILIRFFQLIRVLFWETTGFACANDTKFRGCGYVCNCKLLLSVLFRTVGLICLGHGHNISPFLVKEWFERFNVFSSDVADVDTCTCMRATLASHCSILIRIILVMCACSLQTCLHTACLIVPLMPSTTYSLRIRSYKEISMISRSCSCFQE